MPTIITRRDQLDDPAVRPPRAAQLLHQLLNRDVARDDLLFLAEHVVALEGLPGRTGAAEDVDDAVRGGEDVFVAGEVGIHAELGVTGLLEGADGHLVGCTGVSCRVARRRGPFLGVEG